MPRASSHAVAALFGLIVGSIVGGIVYGLTKIEWPAVCSGVAIAGMLYYAKIHTCARSRSRSGNTTDSLDDVYVAQPSVVVTVQPTAPVATAPVILDEDPC
jgi:hypothetical protein